MPVALCGEIGGRPLEAMALIALGFRDLSMSATSIGPIKAMMLSLDAGPVRADVEDAARTARRRRFLRGRRSPLAERHDVPL